MVKARVGQPWPWLGLWIEVARRSGTGTAPIIGRRCWWPPQVAQVRREPSSPVQQPAELIANPRCNAQAELTRSQVR
jgi:hypothetical protein